MQIKRQKQRQKIAASKDYPITWQQTLWLKWEDGNHQLFATRITWNIKQIQRNIVKRSFCKYSDLSRILVFLSPSSLLTLWDFFSGEFDVRDFIKSHRFFFRKSDDGSGSTTRFAITLEKADACLPLIVQNQEDF